MRPFLLTPFLLSSFSRATTIIIPILELQEFTAFLSLPQKAVRRIYYRCVRCNIFGGGM